VHGEAGDPKLAEMPGDRVAQDRGRSPRTLEDNDKPGRKHATNVARNLHGTAKRVRMLDWRKHWTAVEGIRDLEESDDVSDWFAAGGNVEALRKIIDNLPDFAPNKDGEHEKFDADNHGRPFRDSQKNVRNAMKLLGVTVKHDAFQDRSTITGLEGFSPLDDNALDRLWLTIDERFKFRPTRDFFLRVVMDEAQRNSFHPVCDYIDSLRWDDTPRIDTWLIKYAGAADTPFVRAVSKLTLLAAVRRIRQPGIKFDEMPILISEQGLEKSAALRTLAVRDEWFSDDLPLNADGKRVIESLSGR